MIFAGGLLDAGFVERERARDVLAKIGALVDDFAARAARNDLDKHFPAENFTDLHAAGLMGIQVSSTHGGCGLTPLEYVAAIALMSSGDPSTALAYNMHSTALLSIAELASEEQKRRWFRWVVEDGARVAALGSEPHLKPFIDGAPPKTRLTEVRDGYRLSGRKSYSSFGPNADYLYVVASLGGGLGYAMIPAGTDGIERHDDWDVMAMRSTASVTTDFHEVFVPTNDVVLPQSSSQAMMLEIEFALGYGPIYLAAAATGAAHAINAAKSALDEFLSTPEGRLHPDIGLAFSSAGQISTTIEAAWLMCQKAARTEPIGSFSRAVAIVRAKAVACDAACEAASLALRLAGGRALGSGSPIGRAFRDVQAGQVMAFSPAQAHAMIGRLALGYAPEYITRLLQRESS